MISEMITAKVKTAFNRNPFIPLETFRPLYIRLIVQMMTGIEINDIIINETEVKRLKGSFNICPEGGILTNKEMIDKIRYGAFARVIVPKISINLKFFVRNTEAILITAIRVIRLIKPTVTASLSTAFSTKCISIIPSKYAFPAKPTQIVNTYIANPAPNACQPAIFVNGLTNRIQNSLRFITFNF